MKIKDLRPSVINMIQKLFEDDTRVYSRTDIKEYIDCTENQINTALLTMKANYVWQDARSKLYGSKKAIEKAKEAFKKRNEEFIDKVRRLNNED